MNSKDIVSKVMTKLSKNDSSDSLSLKELDTFKDNLRDDLIFKAKQSEKSMKNCSKIWKDLEKEYPEKDIIKDFPKKDVEKMRSKNLDNRYKASISLEVFLFELKKDLRFEKNQRRVNQT